MLISAVMPITLIYHLPHGQYGYSGYDVASFASSLPWLPSELDVVIVRKEGASQSHHDFRVRRDIVHRALQWLVTHNQYYHANSVHIDVTALAQLPQDGNLTNLTSINVDSPTTDTSETESAGAERPTTQSPATETSSSTYETTDNSNPYDAHLPQSFVPIATRYLPEQEAVQQSVQQQSASPATVM